MDDRKTPTEKRRVIEGMLTGKKDIELLPDDYAPTGIGDTFQPANMPGRRNWKAPVLIASVIVLIVALATAMILLKDQFFTLMSGDTKATVSADQSSELSKLRRENREFRAARETGGSGSIELANLKSANTSLESQLADSQRRIKGLEQKLAGLGTPVGSEAGDSGLPYAELQSRLQDARAEIEEIQGKLSVAGQELSSLRAEQSSAIKRANKLSRENTRFGEEISRSEKALQEARRLRGENETLRNRFNVVSRDLEAARSEIQVLESLAENGGGGDQQLDDVNIEYRRVLQVLAESRDANNKKQGRVEELLAENGKLRQKVSELESERRQQYARSSGNSSGTTRSGNNSGSVNSSPENAVDSRSAGVYAPIPTKIVRPKYPQSAFRRRVAGVVEVRVLVSKDGRVLQAKVIKSPDPLGSLDRAALEALKLWRFDPARKGGQPVEAWHTIPLEFTLRR